MFLKLTPQTLPDVQSANVVAEIKGRELPDEIILIGAHLDSWDLGTGAVDNGSGVAMVMETMRLLKTMNIRPRRTVRAVLFMNEENGLKGARGYFEAHKSEIANHVATIEADSGAAMPLGFTTNLNDSQRESLAPLVASLSKVNASALTYSASTGADTSPLTGAGVRGFGLRPENSKYFHYHHTPADTLDKIDPKELAACSAAVAGLTYTLAEMPEDQQNKILQFTPPKPAEQ